MGRRGRWFGVLAVLAAMAVLLAWLWFSPRAASVASEDPTARPLGAEARPGVIATSAPSLDGGSTLPTQGPPADAVFEVLVTAEGRPVAEVLITAARQEPTSSAGRPTWELPLKARTDGQGRVELAASPGTWILSAVKDGFATVVLDVVKPAGERVTPVRMSLDQGHELRGLALDSKDSPLAPATIRATPLGDRSTRRRNAPLGVVETTVDAKGAFHFSALSSGWWRLEGDAEGAGRAEPVMISVPTTEVVRLRFRRSGFLEGVVVQADGGVAPRALVVVTNLEGTDSLEASATGTFSTERMPGAYRVSARLGEWVGTADQVALVRAGGTTTTRVELSGKGGTLAGTVKRDDGVPVGGALVIASPHNEDGQCGQAVTEADGTFAIRGFPRGTFDLEAEAKGLMKTAETGFFVSEGSTVHADLVLRRLGAVKGTVETSTGAPLTIRVTLHSLRNSFPNRQAVSDGSGRFTFDDVPPGPAFLTASRTAEETSRGTDVKVESGVTSEVKVVFVEPVSLEVEFDRSRCTPPSDVTLVAMEPNASQKRVQRRVAPSTPRVTLLLSPGLWQLMAWDTNLKHCSLTSGMKSVTLEAGQKPSPVRLEFGPAEAMFEITVLEADGQPAPFASITARDDKGSMWASSADADGVAQVKFPAAAVIKVTASKQGRSAQLTGIRRSLGHVTLTLRPAARIHLRIEGGSGMTRVSALLDGEHFADEIRATGAEAWIEEVPAGSITLTAGSADDKNAGTARVVTTSGQTTEALVRLAPVALVRGKVQLPPGNAAGAWVSLTSPLGTEAAEIRADGTFAFEPVPAGDYSAKVECPACSGWVAKPVSLAPGAEVELVFP